MKKRLLFGAIVVTVMGFLFAASHPSLFVQAATTFSVNSIGDDPDDNPGDGTCETATPGECTLRAAIQEANATAGTDTINFAIAGAGLHTLTPASPYDNITEAVTINGYSQTGSSANTAAAPLALNGTLTIEIDGSGAGVGVNCLTITAGSSTVRGLIINNFGGGAILLNTTGGNVVAGNYIGTNNTGTADEGNGSQGISIASGSNTVGGTAAADRNLISGNGTQGIAIGGDSSDGNTIAGNLIGTNAAGTGDVGNSQAGVLVGDSSDSNTVGGTATGSINVVSGNDNIGVLVTGSGTSNNTILGNYIGTTRTGAAALANTNSGVQTTNSATNTTVGGATAASRNIISGNTGSGVQLETDNNTVSGNYIGLDVTGATAVSNGITGVAVNGSTNTIGGTSTGSGNVISGNTASGIELAETASENLVQGNYIGTDATGSTAVPNDVGVSFSAIGSAANNTIGGTVSGARNIISGNTNSGIFYMTDATGNVIEGNYIGTDVTGLLDLGNGGLGITCENRSIGVLIGGTSAASRNIISGNGQAGIGLGGTNAEVQGNYLGLNKDGSAVIANTGTTNNANLSITGSNNTVGGTVAGSGNVISGTPNVGVAVAGLTPFGGAQATSNKIQGNFIGTNPAGNVETGFGNTGNGIQVALDAVNTLVGGSQTGAGNTIAGNGGGVAVVTFTGGTPAINNSILGNSIHDNSGGPITSLGIDLLQTANFSTYVNAGVTPNDVDDVDFGGTNTGTNHYLNFPVISSVSSTNGTATITYDLDINDSESGATGYRVEFFANTTPDASGNGEGETYLGSDTVSGDVTNRQATITLPAGVSGTKYIVATTTMTDASADGFGHSSEFSANTQAVLAAATTNGGGAGSDLANTGRNVRILWVAAGVLLCSGVLVATKMIRRHHHTIGGR